VLLLLVVLLDPFGTLRVDALKGSDRHLLRLAGDPDVAAVPGAAAPVTAAAAPDGPAAADPAPDAPAATAEAAVAAAGVDTRVPVEATNLPYGYCRAGCAWYTNRCYDCRAGWYSPGGRRPVCLPCPVGSVSTAGSSSCTPCKDVVGKGPGWTTWSRGSTTCEFCKPGYAGAGCDKCPQGTWSRGGRARNSLKCQSCPEGWDTAAAGATSPAACNREYLCRHGDTPVVGMMCVCPHSSRTGGLWRVCQGCVKQRGRATFSHPRHGSNK
jgi:hypothetical protein